MSQLLDLADKVHSGQLSAATHLQKVALKFIGTPQRIADRAPSAPESVRRPLRRVGRFAAPVASVLGTPAEYAAYASRSSREWAELQLSFQAKVYETLLGGGPAATDSGAASEPVLAAVADVPPAAGPVAEGMVGAAKVSTGKPTRKGTQASKS
jgi:hypothetical protein